MVRSLIPRGSRSWPMMRPFESEMENLMEQFFGDGGKWPTTTDRFRPNVNLSENEKEFEITVELPGMKAEDFHVELEGNELRISGEKKEEKEEKGKTYHRIERSFGEFRRVVPLHTAVDADQIKAEYKDGVLSVKVPKAEEAKAKKIDVKA